MRTVSTGKEWFTAEHLSEDTADAPDVNCESVLFERQHDFGSSVPTCRDVSVHESHQLSARRGRKADGLGHESDCLLFAYEGAPG